VEQTRLETEYLGRLKELGEIVWKVQVNAIEQMLKRIEEKQEKKREKRKEKSKEYLGDPGARDIH